jgi:hypothetical protein
MCNGEVLIVVPAFGEEILSVQIHILRTEVDKCNST